RRHTRFSRDWSSDVCSSDLTGGNQNSSVLGNQLGGPGGMGGDVIVTNSGSISLGDTQSRLTGFAQGAGIQAISNGGRGGENNGRSEERRVGKGERARGGWRA